MPKQEYKILEFHGGTNNKFDPRDINDNQNVNSQFSINKPGKLSLEGAALTLYDKTDINGAAIASGIASSPATGGFAKGYGLFAFSHDYSMETTPTEVDTEFVVINDANGIDIYDPNQTSDEWQNDKFTLGSRTKDVKPDYYNVDGALRVCDSNFDKDDVGINTDLAATKNDVKIGIANSAAILAGHIIQINEEIMYVIAGGDAGAVDEITVIRGFANTKIVSHLTGQDIYYVNIPKYFGHIKIDRLSETDSSNSINTWVLDAQSPQPPNNTRTGATAAPHLAASGVQSLRVYDIIEGSTTNYPAASEKVILEFSEGSGSVGIIKVVWSGSLPQGNLTLTTSGYGNSASSGHKLKSGQIITIDNPPSSLSSISGPHEVLSTPDATSFTINVDGASSSLDLDATPSGGETYSATADAWLDIGGDGGDFPNHVQVSVDETDMPGLQQDGSFYIHITGQTGVNAFNGIHYATRIASDTDDLRFESPSHESVGDVAGTTEIQQLLGVVRPESGEAINKDLKRKWDFAMSFTYDGPGLEVQESLLTHGYHTVPATQTDGVTSNLINFLGSELMVNGNSPGAANWTERDTDGGTDGFSTFADDANPIIFDKSEAQDSSAINTLTGDAIDAGERYSLTFTVAVASLNIAIGGGDLSGNAADEPFVAANDYAIGTHTVTFQATADRTHLWITVDSGDSDGDGTLDTFSLKANGYGSGETSIVVDAGGVFSSGDSIILGTEELYISSVDTHTLTVIRGYNGSTAAHHGNNTQIYLIKELSTTETVDWTNFVGVPSCVIKFLYKYGAANSSTWNARINGFKIYMKDVTEGDATKDWRLFSQVNFNKGTYNLFAAHDSELVLEQPGTWSTDYKVATLSSGTDLTIKPIDTYLSENLFTEETIIDAQYKASTTIGRRTYIGNIKQGGRTYPDRMIRTPVNKFDTFPETNYIDVAIGDGDHIIELMSYGDRLIQFKKNKVYIINVSGESEVLESEYSNAGIHMPSQVCKTNDGIAWVNKSGLWYFDGKAVNNLTRHVESSAFAEIISNEIISIIGYDKLTNRLIYTPKVQGGLGTNWYVWDIELKAHQSFFTGFIFPTGEVGSFYTNMINDSDGNLVIGYVDSENFAQELNFYEWDSTDTGHQPFGTTTIPLYRTKDIDFGSPAVRKKIYKVYVTYKSSGHSGIKMQYGTDGASSSISDSTLLTGTFSNSTNYDTGEGIGFKDTAGGDGEKPQWTVAELKPSSSINNVKSIQFDFIANEFASESGTARGGSSTTLQLNDHAEVSESDNTYNNYNIYIYDGTGRYNSRRITDYTGSSETVEFAALTERGYTNAASSTSKYKLGSMSPDFEINDITIIYRMKPIK